MPTNNNSLFKPALKSFWLFPEEHGWVVKNLYKFGLIKFDNDRNLPLKSGGKTDIYINLRDARNNPEAIEFLSNLFSIAIKRLGPDRFIEIPDSVSCFAGPLAIETNTPYLTIREQSKDGRATDAKVIGKCQKGDNVAIIDDVITDGASKIVPIKQCQELGLNLLSLIVLVDRQQGWKNYFSEQNININVWAGLTLHDIRRQLIELGLMQRCSSEIEDKNPIIAALDGKNWDEILSIIDPLRTTGTILKVNDLLFEEGFNLIDDLSVYGRVMADLKLHDIGNTITNICDKLKKHKPWAVTIHASGGEKMIEAAVQSLKATGIKVLVITVPTSIDEKDCERIYNHSTKEAVAKLAQIAAWHNINGFVCSTEEVAMLKELYPDKTLVVPGIRSNGVEKNDQSRTGTPAGAIAAGATHIVMGRQILNTPDPVEEIKRVLKEELKIRI